MYIFEAKLLLLTMSHSVLLVEQEIDFVAETTLTFPIRNVEQVGDGLAARAPTPVLPR